MGRAPCCSKVGLQRGPWSPREDALLINYIQAHGEGQWRSMPKKAGLLRCGKSCRLRWLNYLRPDIKRGNITPDEEDLIIRLHSLLGNRWSLIAGRLPGRTDNEIKNYWNTHLVKRVQLKSQGSETNYNTHNKNMITGLLDPLDDQPSYNGSWSKRRRSTTKYRSKRTQATKKTKVHIPKAIKVTSLSLPRNNSFESNITSASMGMMVCEPPINGSNPSWPDDFDCEHESGGLVVDDYDDIMSPIMSQASGQIQFEEMYEEYLQLIKVDHGMIINDKYRDDDKGREDEAQLNLIAESLLD